MAITVVGPSYLDHTIRVHGTLSLDGSRHISQEYKHAGGTGLCYGIALARQGNATTLFSVLGNDTIAHTIKNSVDNEANLQAVWQQRAQASDYAVLLLDEDNHKCVASRKEISGSWRADSTFLDHIASSKALVLTSFDNTIVLAILRSLTKSNTRKPFVMWAPHFNNCAQARILEPMLPAIDHITLSQEEYDRLHQEIGDPTKKGVKSVTATCGKEGVALIQNGHTNRFEQLLSIEKPLDTNGAGEAFGAAFLTALLQTNDHHHAILAGSFVGAMHTERLGSDFPRIRFARRLVGYNDEQ
ncbi:MAG TPA: carbohydrate kinase family protein [Nevskiaceae bacterium]|nr:carbohydrate kinase family protein [Nevskiaceae bacterium]